eukprot:2473578-Pyramimonas_sp.AAC.1
MRRCGGMITKMTWGCYYTDCRKPSQAGLLYAMYLVCAVLPFGTVHFAPECKTWLGLSTGHTKRKRGDTTGTPSRTD